MALVGDILYRFRGDSSGLTAASAESTRALTTIGRSAQQMASQIGSASQQSTRSLSSMRQTILDNRAEIRMLGVAMTAAGAGIVAPLRSAVKVNMAFEQSMANVRSVCGATAEELEKITMFARKMGQTTVFTASQSAQAMYYLASAGYDVDQTMKALEGTLSLAAATGYDLAETSASVVKTLAQYNLDASQAGRISNVFSAAVARSQAEMRKLAESMKFVGTVAAGVDMSVEQTVAILSKLYDVGLDGSMAGTALRGAFINLMAPAGRAAEVLDRYNISVGRDTEQSLALKEQLRGVTAQIEDMEASGDTASETYLDLVESQSALLSSIRDNMEGMRDFADIMDDLRNSGMTTADVMLLFGRRAGPGMVRFVREGGQSIREYQALITGTSSATEMQAIQIGTASGAVRLWTSAVEELQIAATTGLLPAITSVLHSATDVVRVVGEWAQAHPRLTTALVSFAGVIGGLMLVGGPFMLLAPTLLQLTVVIPTLIALMGELGVATKLLSLTMTATKIGLIITAIAIASTALYAGYRSIKGEAASLTPTVSEATQAFINQTSAVSSLVDIQDALLQNGARLVELQTQLRTAELSAQERAQTQADVDALYASREQLINQETKWVESEKRMKEQMEAFQATQQKERMTEERLQAERELTQEIYRNTHTRYEIELKSMRDKEAALKKLGVNEVFIRQWVKSERNRIETEEMDFVAEEQKRKLAEDSEIQRQRLEAERQIQHEINLMSAPTEAGKQVENLRYQYELELQSHQEMLDSKRISQEEFNSWKTLSDAQLQNNILEAQSTQLRDTREWSSRMIQIWREQGLTTQEINKRIAEANREHMTTMVDGFVVALQEMEANAQSWADRTYDLMGSFSSGTKDLISSMLVDSIEGDFTDLGEYIQRFTSGLLTVVVNQLIQMMGVWIAKQILGQAAQSTTISLLVTETATVSTLTAAYIGLAAAKAASGFTGGGLIPAAFQTGGPVVGVGTGDHVPILAEPGEYMSDRRTVQHFGMSFFDNLKSIARSPAQSYSPGRYQGGGPVISGPGAPGGQKLTVVNLIDEDQLNRYYNSDRFGEVLVNKLGPKILERLF